MEEENQRRSLPSLLRDFNKCILGPEEERRGDKGQEVCAAGRRTKKEMESRGNCKVNARKKSSIPFRRGLVDFREFCAALPSFQV